MSTLNCKNLLGKNTVAYFLKGACRRKKGFISLGSGTKCNAKHFFVKSQQTGVFVPGKLFQTSLMFASNPSEVPFKCSTLGQATGLFKVLPVLGANLGYFFLALPLSCTSFQPWPYSLTYKDLTKKDCQVQTLQLIFQEVERERKKFYNVDTWGVPEQRPPNASEKQNP